MSRSRSMGVYQPRARRQAFADAMAEARHVVLRALKAAAIRSLGGLLFLAGVAGLLALASYSAGDPSFDNATAREATNLLGNFGALTADILLRCFGFAALAFLAPPAIWGARTFAGRETENTFWRAIAWPLGTLFVAAGLGLLPALSALPAGNGGFVGILVTGLSAHAASVWDQPWLGYALPLLLLAAGLPLAFLATGLRWRPLAEGAMNIPAFVIWGTSQFRIPDWLRGRGRTDENERREPGFDSDDREYDEDEEEEWEEDDEAEEDEDDEDEAPAPAARSRNPIRVKREDRKPVPQTGKRDRQPALNLGSEDYEFPPLGLLAEPVTLSDNTSLSDEALEENARMLESVLVDFGVRGRIVAVRPGPVVTLYEFEPAAGVKSSRVISLADDVARSMSAVAARIAVIPGRNVMGIELPNHTRETVYLRELLASGEYAKARAPLILALGKTIGGEPVMADLAKMPHLLIAGTTGSGKSVALNTMILSLLYRLPPDRTKMILIDPKMLELSVYDGIPHLLAPVVTDPRKAVVALKWAVREMEERYRKMSKLGVRGIEAFNDRVNKAAEKGETLKRTVQTGFDRETGKPMYEDEVLELEPMPYIVVVVDEVADLMMISGKEIEGAVQRLAQMARAAGIHLIAATQRPSVDVITGTIKANFPTRISFQVTSKIDSRTILGEQGAEQLLGQGDMLHMMAGGRIRRVHGPFVSDHEVEDVVSFLKTQGVPEYLDAVTEEPDEDGDDPYGLFGGGNSNSGDDLYDKALAIVARERKGTTSYIQRRLQIGYNRAARLIERMEEEGVLSKPNHKGQREVLLPDHGEN
ncbi:MAG: DNA translocase FtsK 4TM domain-containing protein [Alphaproteobacteria bacterium]|nr:DNA translocase FtsK 4TM domain-containing protein [Alphaproteobacteria bacterium]MBN9568188.1 DNA translocase FtsK 4TM domain-containing protein [Alphaproteobacteria bacterium]MBN9571710.1 DNA translocase FtsK 4TM domain-containing protein [Alphaproteobacteria bacterium]